MLFNNVIFIIEKKGKVNHFIVDLKPLNKVIIFNVYFILLQSKIIKALKRK